MPTDLVLLIVTAVLAVMAFVAAVVAVRAARRSARVVPDATSAWKPEMAPQAMVMKQKGNSGPGMIGPPPLTYSVMAGSCSTGLTITMPSTSSVMVPIFMNELR